MATAEQWTVRVEQWRASGLTSEKFCEGREFTKKSLLAWSSKLNARARKAADQVKTQSSTFARVVPVSRQSEPGLSVRVAGAEVVIQKGFDPTLLAEVVRALGVVK